MSSSNRLHLDFSLSTNEERAAFLNEYLTRPEFTKRPPTEDELETMGNYLLWGKDPTTGLNAKQAKICDIATKYKTWDADTVESLDGLIEQPTFNEASLQPLGTAAPIKQKREVFSRKEALEKCPDFLRETFVELFRNIDELDLAINYYDLAHGKRKNEPRDTLLIKFSDDEKKKLEEWSATWSQYTYLRKRHQLVELRREQYTLRDSFAPVLVLENNNVLVEPVAPPEFDAEIEVLPLGTYNTSELAAVLFRPWTELTPGTTPDPQKKMISDLLWQKKAYQPSGQQKYFDFRELEHVYQLLQASTELNEAADNAAIESNLPALMRTLEFYKNAADLTEVQREILDLKLSKEKNIDIADRINKKWGKTYTANYISTIFRQRIIPKINEAAAYHVKVASNIFFEEEFKVCSCCKKTFLLDSDNFTKKSRSKDGYTARCKKCEKESRNKSKEK